MSIVKCQELCSVTKYLRGPLLLKFGPKSDQFLQKNQTKIRPKCGPDGNNKTLPVIVRRFISYSLSEQSMHHKNHAQKKGFLALFLLIFVKIRLLSVKSAHFRTFLSKKVQFRTKVRKNRTIMEHRLCVMRNNSSVTS